MTAQICFRLGVRASERSALAQRMKPEKLFPMFLKLSARPCLVVGAGTVAESKIASLLEAGGRVRVVAPEAIPQVRSWAQSNTIEWHQRFFDEATQRGVLCNIVDVPPLCDFYYPAVVQRGALQIAISTSGQSPDLAQRLRKQLEDQFGPEYEEWLAQLGEARDKLHSTKMDPKERKRLLHEHASEKAFEAFLRNRPHSKRSG